MSTIGTDPPAPPGASFGSAEVGLTAIAGGFPFLLGHDFRTRLITHVHPHYVLGVVDAGAVEVTVRGLTYLATEGSVIALRPFEPHTEIPVGNGGWSFRYLYPSEKTVRITFGIAAEGGDSALPLVEPVIQDEDLAGRIATMHLMLSLSAPARPTEEKLAALFDLVRRRYCRTDSSSAAATPTRRRLEAIRRHIIASVPDRVSLPALARSAGLSEFHFSRIFREEVGLSAYAFFDRVRIARAHDLLWSGHSASDVAHRLCYADQPHFTRHFTRASCLAPRQFQELRDRPAPWVRHFTAARKRCRALR